MVEPGAKDCDCSSFGCQSALVSGRVDTAGQSADDRHARISDLVGEPFGALESVVSCAPRAYHANGVLVPQLDSPPHI